MLSSASSPLHELEIADVALDETHREAFEVAPVAGVGEQVEREQVVFRVALGPVADEVRADEPGRARHEEPLPAHDDASPLCAPRTWSFTA